MDQGSIRSFKANYRKQLVQHIIGNTDSAEDISITALDVVWWINSAWKSVTETTIENTFKAAGFKTSTSVSSVPSTTALNNEDFVPEDSSLGELSKALKHVTISGDIMSVNDFVVSSRQTTSNVIMENL